MAKNDGLGDSSAAEVEKTLVAWLAGQATAPDRQQQSKGHGKR